MLPAGRRGLAYTLRLLHLSFDMCITFEQQCITYLLTSFAVY